MKGETVLLGKVDWATKTLPRLLGLLGVRHGQSVLVLAPCNDIHTFGMKRPIDIAFVRADGVVEKSLRDVGANQRIRCTQAVFVLERESCTSAAWPSAGEAIVLGFGKERA